MGSGLGLLVVCDVVVAVANARFTVAEVKLGQAPVTIAPFFARKVGPAHAKRILCMADNLSAVDARRIGLITEVVDEVVDFPQYVESFCDKVTLCAPLAAARAKRLASDVSMRPLTVKVLEHTAEEYDDIRQGNEAAKGRAAVQARTKPCWEANPIKPLF